jgi:hypothetical protein
MSKQIENPAKCEVRAVIRYLSAQNVRPIEFYRQLIAVYGEGVTNESNVRKWCRMFNEGRANVHDEERSGRPSLITEKRNSVALVRERAMPTKRPPLVDEVVPTFADRGCHVVTATDSHGR